MQALTDPE